MSELREISPLSGQLQGSSSHLNSVRTSPGESTRPKAIGRE